MDNDPPRVSFGLYRQFITNAWFAPENAEDYVESGICFEDTSSRCDDLSRTCKNISSWPDSHGMGARLCYQLFVPSCLLLVRMTGCGSFNACLLRRGTQSCSQVVLA